MAIKCVITAENVTNVTSMATAIAMTNLKIVTIDCGNKMWDHC